MSALLVLIALYVAVLSAVGVWAAARVVRRDGQKLGRLRAHVLVHAGLMATTAICALVAASKGSLRPFLLGAALVLYGGSRVHFAWMERHDTTEPGPPLTRDEAAGLRANVRRSRRMAIFTAASLVVLVPVLWIQVGGPWALALLGTGAVSLYAQLWRLPRLYARTIARRGVEPLSRI